MRVDALDDLTVELEYEPQYAVSRRMLGPEIEGEVAQGGFGHNGLASAAGSTLAADAGSPSIGVHVHRADVIDAAHLRRSRQRAKFGIGGKDGGGAHQKRYSEHLDPAVVLRLPL